MKQELITFNRGKVSPFSLGRVDQKRVAMSADVMTNFIPRVLGPMSLRPGMQYITSTHNNAAARNIPFIFSNTDAAIIELTANTLRAIVDDAPVSRPAVSTVLSNEDITSLTGFTDVSDAGGSIASVSGTYLGITGNGTAHGKASRYFTMSPEDIGSVHAVELTVERGPVELSVGSATDEEAYLSRVSLGAGYHSIEFTNSIESDTYIYIGSNLKRQVLVDRLAISPGGIMTVTTPWAQTNLQSVRYDQSADIVYVACDGIAPYKIERRGAGSWSVVKYQPGNGPMLVENTSEITLTPSAISGNITLTASDEIFTSGNVGSLYRLTALGQTVSSDITAENTFTNTINLDGTGASQRTFTINLAGTWVATVTLQVSLDSATGPWSDVATKTWTANTTETYYDSLDNQIAWYRIGVKTGDFTSGTVEASLTTQAGTASGVARVTGYTSSTVVDAEVLSDLGGTSATEFWAEGSWSSRRGYPSAVALHEGRIWWAGNDRIISSVSDDYENFDPLYEGDAGPINRTIGTGPVEAINWMMSLQRLVIGGQSSEYSVRSSSLDEPLTPTLFGVRSASNQGSAPVEPAKVDQTGIYVQRGGYKLYEMSVNTASAEYISNDITIMIPEIGSPGITRMGVQRQPDTRIHAVRSDGTVALAIFDKVEDVLSWQDVETSGEIEDVVVLPSELNTPEDRVYYVVKRDIDTGIASDLNSSATPANILDVSAHTGFPNEAALSDDGLTLFVLGNNDVVYQFTLTTAWDISTAQFASKTLDVSTETANAVGMCLGDSGTKLYIISGTPDRTVFQYTLSTANDLSSAVYATKSLDVGTEEGNPQGGFFNTDGTAFYLAGGSTDTIYEYTVSTAWDITTATPSGDTLDVSTQAATPTGIWANPDGTIFYVADQDTSTVYQYNLGTGYDLSTASYSGNSLDVSTYVVSGLLRGITLGNSGTQLYVIETGNDTLIHYDLTVRTVRYLEKMASENECRGGLLNKQADSFITYTGPSTSVMTGLDHLEGAQVVVWGDGADIGTDSSHQPIYTVSGGQVDLSQSVSNAVVGLPYTGQFKSTKLASTDKTLYQALSAKKNIHHIGLVLAYTHKKGLRFGPSFDILDDMPEIEDDVQVATETPESYAEQTIAFPGTWDVNSRLCLQAQAPRPCTVMAVTLDYKLVST